MGGFDNLGLSPRALDAVHGLGWKEPTPIQAAVLPHLLKGKDVIGEAETGSGKTGAFGLAMTDTTPGPGLTALVLTPTRELAVQVAKDLNVLGEGAAFRAVPVYGGVPWEAQLAEVKRPETTCIVATPGRLLDFIHLQGIRLDKVRFAVIDEADRMFDLGFIKDVERILADLPIKRQLSLFSATFPMEVVRLTRRHMMTAKHLRPGGKPAVPESSEHFRLDVASSQKREAFLKLLEIEEPKLALAFVRKRTDARDLLFWLKEHDVAAAALHGDLEQAKREKVLERFRSGEVPLLVATDLAARGLDVADITHVFNYDVPEESDSYQHRAGRTARAGKPGRVFTIVTEKDHAALIAALDGVEGVKMRRYRIEGFAAAKNVLEGTPAHLPTTGPRKKRVTKQRMKPGWEKRKGR